MKCNLSSNVCNNDKIKVAFIYKPSNPYYSSTYYDTTIYNFFWIALKRSNELDITYFPNEDGFDTAQLKGKFDVILLPNNYHTWTPNLIGIQNLKIPVISKTGDPHYAKKLKQFQYHEKFKIDYYFNFMAEKYFHKFYPRDFKYKTIVLGLEPSLYQSVLPFKDRIKDKILNTGQVGNIKLKSRIANRVIHPRRSNWYFYKLRTLCNQLPYVEKQTLGKEDPKKKQEKFLGNSYPLLLSKYRSAIAATTFYPTTKYWETTCAGCMTFMEVTDLNYGHYLGFEDKKTAIFINENNYRDKFQEYLQNPDDPEWEKIADAGRNYVLNNLTNDHAVKSLVALMREVI